jgi:hypothetical protein
MLAALLKAARFASAEELPTAGIASNRYLPTKPPGVFNRRPTPNAAENLALWHRVVEFDVKNRLGNWPQIDLRTRLSALVGEALLADAEFFKAEKNIALHEGDTLIAVYDAGRAIVHLRKGLHDRDYDALRVQRLPGKANPLDGGMTSELLPISHVLWITGAHHPQAAGLVGSKPGQLRMSLRRMPSVAPAMVCESHFKVLAALGEGALSFMELMEKTALKQDAAMSALLSLTLTRCLSFE